jgi:ankyrin repeat protein
MAGTETTKQPGILSRAWRGRSSPWLPFWLLLVPSAVAGASLATTFGFIVFLLAIAVMPWSALLVAGPIVLAVPVAGAVMAWRCAGNLRSRAGTGAMRLACLALLAVTVWPLWKLGTTQGSYALRQSAALKKEYAALDVDGQLLLAARHGDPKRVGALIVHGANVQAREMKQPDAGRTALHYAAGGYRMAGPGKHVEVAELLVAKGADVNATVEGGYTPLHVASGLGNAEMVSFLLAHGADANAKDRRGTPLSAAVVQGHLEVVKLLLAHGADVNAADSVGSRPIDFISLIGSWYDSHDEIFIRLVGAGADLAPGGKRGNPLASAVNRNRPKVVLAMIDKGAHLDGFVLEGIGVGAHRDIAEVLIARKVEVFTGSSIGATLLHGAACSKDSAFFDWVLANTPDVNAGARNGKTPLHKAARCNAAENAVKLIARKADVNRKDAKGRSPINDLYGPDTLRCAAILLDAGASPDSAGADGVTPLMNTVYVSEAGVARLLVERGADPNLKNRTGSTALHEAARLYKPEVAEVILSAKGIRVDERNAKGDTALLMAARSGAPLMIPMLLGRGADKSIRAPDGRTALEIAEAQGGRWKETADLLR